MASGTEIFSLAGETAIVLGGTGVLGGAMCEALSLAGATVVVMGRNEQRGKDCVDAIELAGGKAFFQRGDALDAESLIDARMLIEDRIKGHASILVNAAGGNSADATLAPGDDFCKLSAKAFEGVFNLNLVGGALIPSQVFGQPMVEAGKGSIINIASMAGIIPLSRVVGYSAAKAAVINLTKFLAREWATTGVRVNAISPGFFPAEQNMKLLYNEDGSYTDRGKQIIDHTPMARFGKADELAGAVVWLAAHQASAFVTGQNIVVDGGFSSVTI